MSVITDLEAMAKRIKRAQGDEQSATYAFQRDEPWNETLRGLPFSCRLWCDYRAMDAARTAYEAAREQRQQLQQELSALSQHLTATASDATLDDQAWSTAYLRGRRLEQAIKDPHNVLAELKANAQRAEEAWGRTWQGYTVTVQEIRRIGRTQPLALLAGRLDGRDEQVCQLQHRQREYEAPRGDERG